MPKIASKGALSALPVFFSVIAQPKKEIALKICTPADDCTLKTNVSLKKKWNLDFLGIYFHFYLR